MHSYNTSVSSDELLDTEVETTTGTKDGSYIGCLRRLKGCSAAIHGFCRPVLRSSSNPNKGWPVLRCDSRPVLRCGTCGNGVGL